MGSDALVNKLNFHVSTQKNETKYFLHISVDSHLQVKSCHNQQAEHLTNSIFLIFFLISCHPAIHCAKIFDPLH